MQSRAGSDAQSAGWVQDWRTKKLAFNNAEIITDAEAAIA
jgi:hypothetical protein